MPEKSELREEDVMRCANVVKMTKEWKARKNKVKHLETSWTYRQHEVFDITSARGVQLPRSYQVSRALEVEMYSSVL